MYKLRYFFYKYLIENKKFVKDTSISLFLYSLISLIFWAKTNFEIYNFSSDFHFYHDNVHNIFNSLNIKTSELSDYLYLNSKNIDEYKSSFFYPIFFLLPITIIGSKLLYCIQGYLIGIGIIVTSYKLLIKTNFYNFLSNKVFIFYILFTTNPTFINECLTNSTMACTVLLVLLSFNAKNNKYKLIFLIFASLIRPNFIVFQISYLLTLLICKPNTYKKDLFTLILSFLFYSLAFLFSYTNYPGNKLNYFLSSDGMNFSSWENYGDLLLFNIFNIDNSYFWKPNLFTLLKEIFTNIELLNFSIQNFLLKYSILIGGQYDSLFQVNHNFWIVRIYKSLIMISISLPGIFNMYKIIFNNLFNKKFKVNFLPYCIYTTIFLSLSSLLVGVTRYALPLHGLLIISSLDFWGLITLKKSISK